MAFNLLGLLEANLFPRRASVSIFYPLVLIYADTHGKRSTQGVLLKAARHRKTDSRQRDLCVGFP